MLVVVVRVVGVEGAGGDANLENHVLVGGIGTGNKCRPEASPSRLDGGLG